MFEDGTSSTNSTFTFGLFTLEADGTYKKQAEKNIAFAKTDFTSGKASATAEFTDLSDGLYYVFELDSAGNAVASGSVFTIDAKTYSVTSDNFAVVKNEKIKILLCPEGGDASKLAKKHQTCDFLIAAALPINYEQIKAKNIIISNSKQDSDILIKKLINTNIKLFSSAYNENIYIDLDKENYKVKEFC